MKKKILKVFALIFCAAIFLTGCATVSNVKINGKDAYFENIQYNQGQVVVVGDYVYFGNGFTSSSEENFKYGEAAKTGYLSRLNKSQDLTFGDKVTDQLKPVSSPNQVEKVNDGKLVGYQNQDMFALGEYIYFTSANTHQTNQLENDYTRVSLFRVKFNGDDFSEIVKNSAFKTGEGSTITVQKGSDNNYYYIIAEPTENNTFSIKSLKIGNSIGKIKTIAEKATSYAIADEASSVKNVVYTVASEPTQTIATTSVKAVDFASGDTTDLDNGVTGSTLNFVGRVGDVVFYSYTYKGVQEIYYKSIANGESNFSPTQKFYNATTIKEIQKAGDGYAFKTSGGALMYKELNASSTLLLTSEQYSDILFVEDDQIYVSNSSTIKRINTVNKEIETILSLEEGKELVSGQCGYDGEYIYFYSKIVYPEIDDMDEDDKPKEDDRYYMFRTDMQGNTQLIGRKG